MKYIVLDVERRNQTRREPAPPPALGADIDTRNMGSRNSLSIGKNIYIYTLVYFCKYLLWYLYKMMYIFKVNIFLYSENNQSSVPVSPTTPSFDKNRNTKKDKNKKNKNKSKKLTKEDIGLPSNFQ